MNAKVRSWIGLVGLAVYLLAGFGMLAVLVLFRYLLIESTGMLYARFMLWTAPHTHKYEMLIGFIALGLLGAGLMAGDKYIFKTQPGFGWGKIFWSGFIAYPFVVVLSAVALGGLYYGVIIPLFF